MDTCFELIKNELLTSRNQYPPIHSLHEGYAIILEELDEFKSEVWKKGNMRDPEAMFKELIQVAAMCVRVAEDCGLVKS